MASFSFLVGIFCGFLSGCGIGGGSVLMVWLTAAADFSSRDAAGINLLFFIPAAVGGLLFHIRRNLIVKRIFFPAILSGSMMAALGVWLSKLVSSELLRMLYGIFLCISGILEIRKSRGK